MAADGEHQAGNSDTAYPQRHVLLTDGSSGIGLEAAIQLLEAGHRLTVLCRDAATGGRLAKQYLQLSTGRGCIGEQDRGSGCFALSNRHRAGLLHTHRCECSFCIVDRRRNAW